MFRPVLEFLEAHDDYLISGHVNPDGDCLGTAVALYHFLESLGKKVQIVNADLRDPSFDFFDRHTPMKVHSPGLPLPQHSVHCLVDCHQLSRLGSVGEAARRLTGIERLVVDHHLGADQGDGDHLLWDIDAPSSGCLIYDLFRESGAPLPLPAAEGVFVSIVADTGWFKYSNTTDESLAIAADLVARGVEPHRIHRWLYQRNPAGMLAVRAQGLQRIEFSEGGRLAVCALDKEFMRKVEECAYNTDSFLDAMREVGSVEIVVLLKEKANGRVKLSLRGNDEQDVDRIAREFGGGGHRKAAGAERPGPLAAVREAVVAACRQQLGQGSPT
ncbi:MAG: bifunctional oligoribonuclease/PAP phosphatase NrnA [Planctomycetota bacterium]